MTGVFFYLVEIEVQLWGIIVTYFVVWTKANTFRCLDEGFLHFVVGRKFS